MAGTRKRWIGLALGALLVVLVVFGLASRDQPPEVKASVAKRENLSAYITSNGRVEPIQPYIARAQFATFVDRVEAVEGQAVHRGQTILMLNADDAKAQLAKARADLLEAEERLRNARAGGSPEQVAQVNGDLRRTQIDIANLQKAEKALEKLVQEKAATLDDLDQNQSKLAQAKATLEMLEQKKAALAAQASVNAQSAVLEAQHDRDRIASLEDDVRSATVVSPLEGTLYSLSVRPGDYVTVGQTLAEMADLHHVRVRAFVDEPDLGWLETNQPVDITWDALPGRVWTGRTEQIPKQVVSHGVRSVGEVLCSVSNDQLALIPNINVDVRIKVRERPNALVVPRAAVHFDNSQHFVFLIQSDRLHQRPVQVGIANATEYEILSGLNDGDQVALPGDVVFRDGMDVRPVEVQ